MHQFDQLSDLAAYIVTLPRPFVLLPIGIPCAGKTRTVESLRSAGALGGARISVCDDLAVKKAEEFGLTPHDAGVQYGKDLWRNECVVLRRAVKSGKSIVIDWPNHFSRNRAQWLRDVFDGNAIKHAKVALVVITSEADARQRWREREKVQHMVSERDFEYVLKRIQYPSDGDGEFDHVVRFET